MQDHQFDFVVEGTPEEVWDVFWSRMRTGIETDTVKIEIYHPGDEAGNGLVRHCDFQVPKYLLSKGRAQSWEWITGAERPVGWRYDAIGKPLPITVMRNGALVDVIAEPSELVAA